MPTVDVRKYSETMRDQSKSSLEEMRKIMRAWVGATDLAYKRMLTELKDLENRNRVQVEKLQKQAKKLNREEVRKQVRETYEDLAKRGEEVIQELRTRPQTRLVFTRTEKALKQAEHKVEDAEHRVTGGPAKANRKPVTHKASANHGKSHTLQPVAEAPWRLIRGASAMPCQPVLT